VAICLKAFVAQELNRKVNNGGLNLIFQNQVQSRPTDVRILIEGKCIETPNIFYYRHLLQSNPLQRSEGTACVPWLGD
jgi:hypothetical protein